MGQAFDDEVFNDMMRRDAHLDGYKAYTNGVKAEDCPYSNSEEGEGM